MNVPKTIRDFNHSTAFENSNSPVTKNGKLLIQVEV
jgi:hypothetical protein